MHKILSTASRELGFTAARSQSGGVGESLGSLPHWFPKSANAAPFQLLLCSVHAETPLPLPLVRLHETTCTEHFFHGGESQGLTALQVRRQRVDL